VKAKILNIDEAIQLYGYLQEFLPFLEEYSTIPAYSSAIIQALMVKQPSIFMDVIILLTGKERSEIILAGEIEAVKVFYQGMILNKILLLTEFMRGLYG